MLKPSGGVEWFKYIFTRSHNQVHQCRQVISTSKPTCLASTAIIAHASPCHIVVHQCSASIRLMLRHRSWTQWKSRAVMLTTLSSLVAQQIVMTTWCASGDDKVVTAAFPGFQWQSLDHDDVIKWTHFPRYWPFVWGIHRSIPLTKASDAELWCFFHMCLDKWLSKQSWGWWFETPSWSLWHHRHMIVCVQAWIDWWTEEITFSK